MLTNQKPRKTIGYCLEKYGCYSFPQPRWCPLFEPIRMQHRYDLTSKLKLQDNSVHASRQKPRWCPIFKPIKSQHICKVTGELRIQDGGAYESRPCWKKAHQPRRTGIDLMDFLGDTNHARVTPKCHAKIDTYNAQWS